MEVMDACQIESGIQFLTRIKSVKSNLHNLENHLFHDQLKPNDVIELSSETNFGKTQMLIHLMKNSILVDSYKDVSIGGLQTHVLFIDTSFHFQITRLSECMRKHIQKLKIPNLKVEDEDEIIKKSLKNLTIIRCYDSQQLFVTFHSLNSLLTSNPKIKFIILDSIGDNYWQDFMNRGLKKMDFYEKKVWTVFRNCIKDFKILVLFVRPEFFVMKNNIGSIPANFKIRVRLKDEKENIFVASVTSKDSNISNNRKFMISSDEIIWIM